MAGLAAPNGAAVALQASRIRLADAARTVICRAHGSAHAAARSGRPQEPDFVAELVLTGVPALHAAWSPVVTAAGGALNTIGVFLHQSPMVTFLDGSGVPQRCELGDLLLAIRYNATGSAKGVASIVQAKMAPATAATGVSHSIASTAQHDLYARWPTITLPRSFARATASIGVQAEQGLLGIIDPGMHTCGSNPPDLWTLEDLAGGVGPTVLPPLSTYCADLIGGISGREFESPIPAGDDWSYLLDELLRLTSHTAFTRRNTGHVKRPRGVVCMATGEVASFELDQGREHAIASRLLAGPWGSTAEPRPDIVEPRSDRPFGIILATIDQQ